MAMKFMPKPNEELRPGDQVSIDDQGLLRKAKAGDARYLGTLPPTTEFKDGMALVPAYWPEQGVDAIHTGAVVVAKPGRPPSGKVRVTMLLDPAVIAKFKAARPTGWQALINDVLMGVKV